ncbi:MAG: helix-turn-helix domain-containing protein [Solirubrobacteraceae bacterium]
MHERPTPGRLGLTVSQVAAELGVSENTIRRWSDAGHLTAYRTPGGQRRFSREAIDAFMAEAQRPPPGPRRP